MEGRKEYSIQPLAGLGDLSLDLQTPNRAPSPRRPPHSALTPQAGYPQHGQRRVKLVTGSEQKITRGAWVASLDFGSSHDLGVLGSRPMLGLMLEPA